MLQLAVLIVVIALLWLIGFLIIIKIKKKCIQEYCFGYTLGTALMSIMVNVINFIVMCKIK